MKGKESYRTTRVHLTTEITTDTFETNLLSWCAMQQNRKKSKNICFQDVYTPIFAWPYWCFVLIHKDKKGSSAISPGQSCKNIKDSGDFNTSGTYWIRATGTLGSFQGYCDMSAVGRKFCRKEEWYILIEIKGYEAILHAPHYSFTVFFF